MNLLSVERVSKRYGVRELFHDVSFGLERGQKVGLLARNGAGKSTLLKCIAGLEKPDEGRVTYNNDIRLGYLQQDVGYTSDASVVDEMFDSDDPLSNAIKAYEHALAMHANEQLMHRAVERMEELKAWDHEARVKSVLFQFGLRDLEQPVKTLSGGQQKRLAMAKVLVNRPDLLILDEPTNHLDLDMIEQLEGELSEPSLTLLLVTHDRYFLDRVCDEIIELEQGSIARFRGSYRYYVEKKALAEDVREATQDKLRALMRHELQWMRRMPRARGTKSKSRVAAFHDLSEEAGRKVNKDEVDLEIKVNRLGGKVIEVRNLTKSLGDRKIVERFHHSFKRGDRIGLVGPNGVGKTTFIELITGRMKPDMGKVTIGETVVLGHYDQRGLRLKEDKRVIEVVRDIAEVIPLSHGKKLSASQLLERLLFDKEQQYNYVSTLSGGERRRLYLCTVLMANPNVLVLDEPTNDLDIPTLNALEDFILDLDACLIVVSHDRYFLDKVCDHLLVFEGDGRIKPFAGDYSTWRERRTAQVPAVPEKKPPSRPSQPVGKRSRTRNAWSSSASTRNCRPWKKERKSSLDRWAIRTQATRRSPGDHWSSKS
jgi:ATP-binding cassette subfamily F protein uup